MMALVLALTAIAAALAGVLVGYNARRWQLRLQCEEIDRLEAQNALYRRDNEEKGRLLRERMRHDTQEVPAP